MRPSSRYILVVRFDPRWGWACLDTLGGASVLFKDVKTAAEFTRKRNVSYELRT